MSTIKFCKGLKADGLRCQAPAMSDSLYCFFHDPHKRSARKTASANGGSKNKATTLSEVERLAKLDSSEQILSLLNDTIHHVRTGQLDPRIANCVGYLSGIALRAIEQGKYEERLASLEAILKDRILSNEHIDDQEKLFSFDVEA